MFTPALLRLKELYPSCHFTFMTQRPSHTWPFPYLWTKCPIFAEAHSSIAGGCYTHHAYPRRYGVLDICTQLLQVNGKDYAVHPGRKHNSLYKERLSIRQRNLMLRRFIM